MTSGTPVDTYHFPEILLLGEVQDLISKKDYSKFSLQDLLKMRVGWELALRVRGGETIGLGSGTTSEAAIRAIGMRLKNKEIAGVRGVATSKKLGKLAENLGFRILNLGFVARLDWGFDGADEVEKGSWRLIKGGGGAHTKERQLALKCKDWVIIVDRSKLVDQLGEFPLAVEVEPEKLALAEKIINKKYQPQGISVRDFTTDSGNKIVDVKMGRGRIKSEWEQEWRKIDGVVDTGLFVQERQPSEVLVAEENGKIKAYKVRP